MQALTIVNNIITQDFKVLFSNIILAYLHDITNELFIKYYPSLNLPDNTDIDYFKSLTIFYCIITIFFKITVFYLA